MVVVFALVGLAVGALCSMPVSKHGEGSSSGIVGLAEEEEAEEAAKEAPACSADGEACMESKCCLPGGDHGLTCYKKNDDYAACAPSCKPGVHEPEEEGTWDETGTFIKAQWSCDKVGKASKPGCHAFSNKSKSECPTDYCMSMGEKCAPRCDTYGEENGCWGSGDCMWTDGQCMQACWGFDKKKTCQPTDKCYWTGSQCQMGWWLFNNYDSCDQDLGYMWNGSCVQDPCSRVGEDCSETKCCSTPRGASGMTCFKKDENWATCQEKCTDKEWDCEALGPRANYSAGCGWAGKDCAVDKLCCNRGFVCAVKDEFFTGCTQTVKVTTWSKMKIPIPADWEGTVVGAGRDEYQMQQAGPDDTKIGHSLYCFMAFLPDSGEEALVEIARKNKASIWGCDGHDLFHTWQSASAGWDTGEATLENTDVFINVWEQVQAKGAYSDYEWTVKVDPDCVMVADRLRYHIDSWNLADWAAVYVKNNGMDAGLGNNGFLGAIEIFTKKAVNIYLDNAYGCKEAMGLDAGEDGFMKGCMDALGVGFVTDVDIFAPDYDPSVCQNEGRVAFHPIKTDKEWQCCVDIVMGKSRHVEYGKCTDDPETIERPWVQDV